MKIAIGSSAKNHQKILGLYIARIAKAASHKLLGKSSLNVSLSCPVLFCHSVPYVGIELLWQ